MGIISYIQSKIRKGTGQDKDSDYIPVEKLPPAGVEVYEKPSIRQRVQGVVSYAKQKAAERQLYQKEKLEKQQANLVAENKALKVQAENARLKAKVARASPQPNNFAGFARSISKGSTPGTSKTIGGGQVFGSTGFNVDAPPAKKPKGSNVFGGGKPFG